MRPLDLSSRLDSRTIFLLTRAAAPNHPATSSNPPRGLKYFKNPKFTLAPLKTTPDRIYIVPQNSKMPIINKTKIDKVFVKGKLASIIFKNISKVKKGRILANKSQINELIRKDLDNNDYLMIKASLATGFNNIVKDLKGLS